MSDSISPHISWWMLAASADVFEDTGATIPRSVYSLFVNIGKYDYLFVRIVLLDLNVYLVTDWDTG